MAKSVFFYALAVAIICFAIDPIVYMCINSEAFIWTLTFLVNLEGWRLPLVGYWIFLVGLAIWMASFWSSSATDTHKQIDLRRKYFHILVIMLFTPGYLLDVNSRLTLG